MIAAGVNATALSSYMGHASVTITYDRYGHLTPGSEGEARAHLDASRVRDSPIPFPTLGRTALLGRFDSESPLYSQKRSFPACSAGEQRRRRSPLRCFTLAFAAGPGGAKVYRLDPHSHALSVYASGFTAITGIAFDKRGRLYVSEFTTAFGPTGPTPDGAVVVVPRGGGVKGRRTIGAGVLHFPGGVGVTRDAVYVSNWSIAGGEDGPLGPGIHGQLLRFSLHHH